MDTKAFYTAITTNELEKTLTFYVGTLGFHVAHRLNGKGGEVLVLENDYGAKLDVIEVPEDAPVGFHALRTNVNDLEAARREFETQGFEIVAGPVEIATGRVLLVKDPNGVLVDVTEHIRKKG